MLYLFTIMLPFGASQSCHGTIYVTLPALSIFSISKTIRKSMLTFDRHMRRQRRRRAGKTRRLRPGAGRLLAEIRLQAKRSVFREAAEVKQVALVIDLVKLQIKKTGGVFFHGIFSIPFKRLFSGIVNTIQNLQRYRTSISN